MKKPSDLGQDQNDVWEKLIGLGERSVRKSYYPELQRRMGELERFRALLDNSNDLIFLLEVPSGNILDVNESACRQVGRSRQELLETAIFECMSPECGEGLRKFFSLPGQDPRRQKLFECLLKTDGNPCPVEVTLNRVTFGEGEYVAAIARDITEHKRAEQALQDALSRAEEAREKTETILKSVADGLIFTDMDDRVILMSAAAEVLLGKKSSEFLLQPLDAAIGNRNLGEHISAIKAGGETAELEIELQAGHGGQLRTIEVKSSLVRGKNGRRDGVITLLRDVSREREFDRAKSEFISTAAHELRTPLTSIRGYAQLLLAEKDLGDEQRREFLSVINEKTRVLERIIDDLLHLSRVESGGIIHLEKTRSDIGAVLSDIVGRYRERCSSHRFETVLPEISTELFADEEKIVHVMENLLSNAVKFSPPGSLIRVLCEASDTDVRVSVRDEGIGMTPEQAERAFEKFYRVDASSTAVGGLGIGMAIAKSIVEAHGGNVRMKSGLGEGTTASFTLPRGEEEHH